MTQNAAHNTRSVIVIHSIRRAFTDGTTAALFEEQCISLFTSNAVSAYEISIEIGLFVFKSIAATFVWVVFNPFFHVRGFSLLPFFFSLVRVKSGAARPAHSLPLLLQATLRLC